MPLPLVPLILGGLAAGAAGYGVKKGLDAKEDFERAERIGHEAKRRHENAVQSIEEDRTIVNAVLVELGRDKIDIFSTQIKRLVDEVRKRKGAGSSLKDFEQKVEGLNLPELEKMVRVSLEFEKGFASGVASGALTGLGAYGSVGMLASASTGTAIASLGGVAATNATLAWLGGGSLAAGGLGIAGGTAVLGGIVAGPALAIMGMSIASKAEEAVTEARAYEAKVDEAIEQIRVMRIALAGVRANAKEMRSTLQKLVSAFDRAAENLDDGGEAAFNRLVVVGKALKMVLDEPIMQKDGEPVSNFKSRIRLHLNKAGLLEI